MDWIWDGNFLKLGCDDGCTTINITKFIRFLKKKKVRKAVWECKFEVDHAFFSRVSQKYQPLECDQL